MFVAGAAVQWLRDGLGLVRDAGETEAIARRTPDAGGVHVVPAFTGLGAPWWDAEARGAVLGITRGTTADVLVRATLESIAFQVADLATAMERDALDPHPRLRVDGGATANDWLMQFQADVLGCEVARPAMLETTALGAGFLAGHGRRDLVGGGRPLLRRAPRARLPSDDRARGATPPARGLARRRRPRAHAALIARATASA